MASDGTDVLAPGGGDLATGAAELHWNYLLEARSLVFALQAASAEADGMKLRLAKFAI